MNKKLLRVTTLAIILMSSATLALSQIDKSIVKDLYAQIELFSYALTMIQSEYVEEKTPQELIYGSLRGMLQSDSIVMRNDPRQAYFGRLFPPDKHGWK